jgi:PAS domain S-box-containing protein
MGAGRSMDLEAELTALRDELAEAREALDAIRTGSVDALVVTSAAGKERIFTLEGSDFAYRALVEQMQEGAATLDATHHILYANHGLARLAGRPLDAVIGGTFCPLFAASDQERICSLVQDCLASRQDRKTEALLETANGIRVPAALSFQAFDVFGSPMLGVIVTDLTEHKATARAEAVKQNEERLRLATDASHAMVYDCSWPARIMEGVYGSEKLIGRAPTRLPVPKRWWTARIHPDDLPSYRDKGALAMRSTVSEYTLEYRVRHAAGNWITVRDTARVVRDEVGRAVRVVGGVIDITEQKLAEDVLEKRVAERTAELDRTNRILQVISSFNEALVRSTCEDELIREICRLSVEKGGFSMAVVGYADDASARVASTGASFGFAPGALERFDLLWSGAGVGGGPTTMAIRSGQVCHRKDFWSEPDLEPWRALAMQEGFRSSIVLPLKDGDKVFAALCIFSFEADAFDEAQTSMFRELASDLAFGILACRSRLERDAARKDAERRAEQLKALAADLVQAEQRERQRLAKVLHDHVQQLLVAAKYGVAGLVRRSSDDDVKASANAVADTLDQAIQASRSLATELFLPVLHEKGLLAAVEWLGRQMLERHGLEVKITADRERYPLATQYRAFVFDAVRELLFNVVKHAGVDRARVGLVQVNDRIEVAVEDDGAGFDVLQIAGGSAGETGLGLFSIRERLGYLGGSLEVESAPGVGSHFRLILPFEAMADEVGAPESDHHSGGTPSRNDRSSV